MIAIDTNILVYAHREEMTFHSQAVEVLKSLHRAGKAWLVPLHCLVECYAVITNPRIFQPASSAADALAFLGDVLAMKGCTIGHDRESTWSRLHSLIREGGVAGPFVHDARIAAVCIDYAVDELWSADRSFSRFPQLKVVNPLVRRS